MNEDKIRNYDELMLMKRKYLMFQTNEVNI